MAACGQAQCVAADTLLQLTLLPVTAVGRFACAPQRAGTGRDWAAQGERAAYPSIPLENHGVVCASVIALPVRQSSGVLWSTPAGPQPPSHNLYLALRPPAKAPSLSTTTNLLAAGMAAGAARQPALGARCAPRASARPTFVALLLVLSQIAAAPTRGFLHLAPSSRAAGWGRRIAGNCAGERDGGWRRHGGGSSALGEMTVLRLRGGVDNTRYYEVLKLPVGEEDENVSALFHFCIPVLFRGFMAQSRRVSPSDSCICLHFEASAYASK